LYIDYKAESAEWGSGLDGIKYHFALAALQTLSEQQVHRVNWRPQVLIMYRLHLSEILKQGSGRQSHQILNFYSQLRKGRGLCIVAAVLEGDKRDAATMHKAKTERAIISDILEAEGLSGFSECVVAPSYSEGANYIIQLTGLGGLTPNTVLMEWPTNWRRNIQKAVEFVGILQVALIEQKCVLAVKNLPSFPVTASQIPKNSTIDIWWIIHDGGLLILLSWLLQQHRIWRKCTLRLFTIMENVTEDVRLQAEAKIRETLRKKQLFDAHVKAIVIEDEMIEPYTYDWTLRATDREQLIAKVNSSKGGAARGANMMPMELDELFREDEEVERGDSVDDLGDDVSLKHRHRGPSKNMVHPTLTSRAESWTGAGQGQSAAGIEKLCQNPDTESRNAAMTGDGLLARAITGEASGRSSKPSNKDKGKWENVAGFNKLNDIIVAESGNAQLVVINLPDVWGTGQEDCERFMSYCDTLTKGLERTAFVHSTGTEMFTM